MALHPNMQMTGSSSPALNRYRMYTAEEGVRQDVTALYNKCGNDLNKMIEAIGTTLHETAGREDIKVYADGNGSLISITQAPQYALQNNRQSAFLRSLDEIMEKTRKELLTHKERLNRELPYNYQNHEEFKKDVQSSMLQNPDSHHIYPVIFAKGAHRSRSNFSSSVKGIPDEVKPRCFPRTAKDDDYAGLPTSNYNGNYTLRRYGGSFPEHANYGFYRKYGLKGKGATTAERHNFPAGSPPRTSTKFI